MSTAGKVSSRSRTERSEMSLSDFQAELFKLESSTEKINGIIYGDSNAGKTRLMGTLPGKNFWLVCEPGYKTAAQAGGQGYGRRITDTASAWAAVEWLEEKDRFRKFNNIVLDGLSTGQDRFRLAYTQEAFDIDSTKRQHRNLPDRPDYFNTQNFLKSWIPRFVDMPGTNFWITCHAYRTNKTDDGELLVFPGIQGKVTEVANAVSGLMDLTGYLVARRVYNRDHTKSKTLRRLYFDQPERRKDEEPVRYVVGDKFDCLGPYIDNPTMPAIIDRINGSDEEEESD